MERFSFDGQEWAVLPGATTRVAVGDVLRCALRHGVAPLASAVPAEWAVSREECAQWQRADPGLATLSAPLDGAYDLAEQSVAVVRLRRPQNVDAGRHDNLAAEYRTSIYELQRLLVQVCNGNVSELARRTGLPRRTLHRRLKDVSAILSPTTALAPSARKVG